MYAVRITKLQKMVNQELKRCAVRLPQPFQNEKCILFVLFTQLQHDAWSAECQICQSLKP